MEDKRLRQWQDVYGEKFEQVSCNPFAEWTAEDMEQLCLAASRGATIPLMGNPARRGCTLTKAVLEGPVANDLFYDSHKVSVVTLERKTD